MEVAEAGKDRLLGLGAALDRQRRIVLESPREGGGEFLLVLGRLGGDRQLHHGLGVLDRRELNLHARGSKGVAGLRAFDLRHGGDVSARDVLGVGVVFALQVKQVVHTYLSSACDLQDFVVGYLSRVDPEQRDAAHEGVAHGLEHVPERGSVGCGLVVALDSGRVHPLERIGCEVDQELGEGVYSDQLGSRTDEYREDVCSKHALVNRLDHDIPGRLHAFEVGLHHGFVGLDDGLDQGFMGRRCPGPDVVWDVIGRGALLVAVAVDEHLLGDHSRQAAKVALLAHGDVYRSHSLAKDLSELLEGALERGPLPVELGDEDRPGDAFFGGHPPERLGAHFDTVDARDDEDCEVCGPECGTCVAGEVRIARSVQDIDLVATPHCRCDRQAEGDVPLLFLWLVVEYRRSLVHRSLPGGCTGHIEEGFGEGGLAAPSVADEGDVADLFRDQSNLLSGRECELSYGRIRRCRGPASSGSATLPPLVIDMRLRPRIQWFLKPIGRFLARIGVSPTFMTIVGLLIAVVGAIVIGLGALAWGGVIALLGSAIDGLDGSVARAAGKVTARGAYLDAVIDRLGEIAVLTGLAVSQRGDARILLLTTLSMGGALMIPYVRAKADSVGVEGRSGLMGRAERVILVTLGLVTGFVEPMLWILIVTSWFTVGQRFWSTYRLIDS